MNSAQPCASSAVANCYDGLLRTALSWLLRSNPLPTKEGVLRSQTGAPADYPGAQVTFTDKQTERSGLTKGRENEVFYILDNQKENKA